MNSNKLCLGIESTAHTFGISIVDFDGKVLSNEKDNFTTLKGGMIPAKVADHHADVCGDVTKRALQKAGCSMQNIQLIAYSRSPGIGHMLKIGHFVAKFLSQKYNLPVIGVNHCIAHLEIGRLLGREQKTEHSKQKAENSKQNSAHRPLPTTLRSLPIDPILLYASGANTQIIAYEANKYRIFGETLDIGIGNFLDSFARALELGFPGGPKIEQLAVKGKQFIPLPYVVKGMDVSFGGLNTNLKQKIKSKEYSKEDLCYSVQETVFAMLLEVSERALAHTGKKELLLGGGVACNKRLQEMATKMCEARGAKCYILENEFNVDNAAMIAWTGILMSSKRNTTHSLPNTARSSQPTAYSLPPISPYERTDEVDVYWR